MKLTKKDLELLKKFPTVPKEFFILIKSIDQRFSKAFKELASK